MRRASDELHTGRAGGGPAVHRLHLGKCEKALDKLRPGSSAYTLTVRRIRAFRIALALIGRELGEDGPNEEERP